MPDKQLTINEESLKNELQLYKDKPYVALFEYIWNSFDAQATEVDINFDIPDSGIGYLKNLEIKDNGKGWDVNSLDTKTFLSSHKSEEKQKNKTLPHGKWGRGRYVFIWFSDQLVVNSSNKSLTLHKDIKLEISQETNNSTGTSVNLINLDERLSNALLDTNQLKKELALEFCWFLEQNSIYQIRINGEKLTYDFLIKKDVLLKKGDFSADLQASLDDDLEVHVILWNDKPREFAKFYFIDKSSNVELFTKFTSLNKQKDDYWHSVYIKSAMFTSNDQENLDANDDQQQIDFDKGANRIKKRLLDEIRKKLIELRKPILAELSQEIVRELHSEEIIPKLEDFGVLDTDSFDDLLKQVFVIAPFLFIGKSKEEKKFLCAVLAGLLSSQEKNLISVILQQIQELTLDEQNDLLDILNRTSLSNIVRTIKEIDSRLQVLSDLEKLLFDYRKSTLEVKHLQEVLNLNPWIFGEQFRLFRNTEGALNKTLYDYAKNILSIDNPEIITDSRKEVDLFLVKTMEENESKRNNVVVEIKRPSIKLGKGEYDQIENYALTITKEPICNGNNTHWDFILIGDDYDDYVNVKIEQARNFGEESKGLTFNDSGKSKIYVRKWSDVLNELSYKMKYLKDQLQIESKKLASENPSQIVSRYNPDSIPDNVN